MERKIGIATGDSRFQQRGWKNESYTWEDLVERLSSPTVTQETMAEYSAMDHSKRTDVKDVGGFIGGWLNDGRRRVENVYCRDLLTYDYDKFSFEGFGRMREALEGKAWCLYSTHSHRDDDWRVRLLVPMSREVTPDEFPAVARKIAERIGFEGLDRGSFDLNRLMFWPSVSHDGPYMFETGEGEFLNPGEVLAEYEDWRDASAWPLLPEENAASLFSATEKPGAAMRAFSRRGNGGRMEDPAEKEGIIGAWCRTYDIRGAIAKYLSHIYTPASNGHFTHVGSSTSGSALVREGGKFLYSFHGTDPLQRRMLNSWDLVRLALFRNEDEGLPEDTRVSRLKSTKKMEALAFRDKAVKSLFLREQHSDFDKSDFEGGETAGKAAPAPENSDDVFELLDVTKKGEVEVTSRNVEKILDTDPLLKDKFRLDIFQDNIRILGELPWKNHGENWVNKDSDALFTYLDKTYGLRKNVQLIKRTFNAFIYEKGVHPVKEYLKGLPEWDGVPRLGKLFTDVLGAEDTPLNRKLAEIVFVAAVRRIYQPGVKFDYCVILYGPEGAYKSTLLSVMGGEWFSDSVNSIEGKEGMEGVQGVWIVEIGELTGLKKSEVSAQKQFISRQVDMFRPAYAERKEWRPRQCVMVGTTNEEHFLKGIIEGNRRMPVVEIDPTLRKIDGNPREWLIANRDQVWAEAKKLEAEGMALYLSDDYKDEISRLQDKHNIDLADPLFTSLQDYLDWWLPYGWEKKDPEERKATALSDPHYEGYGRFQRNSVTIPEILEECFGIQKSNPGYSQMARKMGQYMKRIRGWYVAGNLRGIYGKQKTWQRFDISGNEGQSGNEENDSFISTPELSLFDL